MKTINEQYPLYGVPHIDTLQDVIRTSAAKYPTRIAVRDLRPTPIPSLTHRTFLDTIIAFGAALRAAGVPDRAHIAVISENRVQWILSYLTLASFNMVAVPIDRNLDENEILTIMHASDAVGAIFSENFRDMFIGFRHSLTHLQWLVDMDSPRSTDEVLSMVQMVHSGPATASDAMPRIDPEAMAAIVFTSGSMGRAKGVMLTHRNIASNLMDMLKMIEIVADDRFMSVLPIHHTYECTCGNLCPLLTGGSVHYARSLKTVSEDMVTIKPTVLLGVPLLYEKMYRRIEQAINESKVTALLVGPLQSTAGVLESIGMQDVRRRIFHKVHEKFGGCIRILIVGGAAPDPAVARGFRALGFQFVQGYGLTETSPILALNRLRNFKDDAAGIPLPGLEIRIDAPDEDGGGEIVVRGPSVMKGYYKNDAATAAVLHDGWFSTGDFGSFDADGFLHINGRKKNVIISRTGKNVFPEELEDVINKSPYVLESVVYGKRLPTGDEEIAAIIVPKAEEFIQYEKKHRVELTQELIQKVLEDEIRAINRRLPVYKNIRSVEIREQEFLKTTTQKIKRYLAKSQDAN